MMLNALVWTTGLDVPAEGVVSTVSDEDMVANLDDKQPKPAAAKPAAVKPASKPAGGGSAAAAEQIDALA